MTDEFAALVAGTRDAMVDRDHVVKIEYRSDRQASLRCVICNGAAAVFSTHHVALADAKAQNTCSKKQWSLWANYLK